MDKFIHSINCATKLGLAIGSEKTIKSIALYYLIKLWGMKINYVLKNDILMVIKYNMCIHI